MADRWPKLKRSQRMPNGLRRQTAERVARLYREGKSVRDLSRETGYSIGRVRRLMDEVGVTYRPRGGSHRSQTTD